MGGQPSIATKEIGTEKSRADWRPTTDPKAAIQPGQMRSDVEDIPAGFSKADADRAEIMEAALHMRRSGIGPLAAPGCQVYWPAPYEVCGAIRDKYNTLGGPNSFLLWPKTNELTNPDGIGKRTEFQNGPIYWSPQGGAHPVVNHFLAAWARHGYENSYIGYPTTDEIVNPDGIGRRQHFTGSTIYWKLNEAYSIGGAIADRWHALGAEQGDLGYPISDEMVLPDGAGRMNRFERGVIYWHPTTGAHPVQGDILAQWSHQGYELSPYGYPVGSATDDGTGWFTQQFQHGSLSGEFSSELPNAIQLTYLPFDTEEEAWEYFDAISEGTLTKSTPQPQKSETQTMGTGVQYGPCYLEPRYIHWRTKSGPGARIGFKPVTKCETKVSLIKHETRLMYEYWNFWKTAYSQPWKASNTSYTEQTNLDFYCRGDVRTLFWGDTKGTIVYGGKEYYAYVMPPSMRFNCQV